jgi:catechol 2,3-dioxygenase-like lactoylglutathione lyase family enzyme
MTLRGFATLTFWSDDVAAAVAWYTEFLGVAPYFTRPGPGGQLTYAKFRTGDQEAELAIADRSFDPSGNGHRPGGAVLHWHVDDLDATLVRLASMGAREYEPVIEHGPVTTAAVVDPFGNLLGIMHNPHYLQVLDPRRTVAAPV